MGSVTTLGKKRGAGGRHRSNSFVCLCFSADHITSLKARIVPRALWELDTLEKFMWAWLHFNKIWAPVFLWLPLKISSCNKLITTGKQTSHFRARYVQSLAEVTGGLTLCSSWGSDPETICFVLGKKKKVVPSWASQTGKLWTLNPSNYLQHECPSTTREH